MGPRVLAGAILAVAAGLLVWLLTSSSGDPVRNGRGESSGAGIPRTPAVADSVTPREGIEIAPVAPSPEASSPNEKIAANALVIRGCVVDERLVPVVGARVHLHRPGEAAVSTESGEGGRFRLEDVRRPAETYILGGLVARVPDGRIGIVALHFGSESPTEVEADNLVVTAARSLQVLVKDGGAPVPGARVLAAHESIWFFESVTGSDGIARFDALPRKAMRFLAKAENPSRAGRADAAQDEDVTEPVEIALAATRTIEVTVVEKGTEKPIPGAVFRINQQVQLSGMLMAAEPGGLPPVAPTDAGGRTRIEGTCAEDVLVLHEVEAPGYFSIHAGRGATVKAGVTQARILMVGERALRFPVVAGEVPVPPDGSVITLSRFPGTLGPLPSGSARMDGSELVVQGATSSHFSAIATAPDGSMTSLWADDKGTPPKEVSFRPERLIEIRATREDGSPAAGVMIGLRNQGNNPVGSPKATGEDGRLVLDGLYGGLVEVQLLSNPPGPWGGRVVGSVDLSKGGGRIDVTIPDRRQFVARVSVDGEPRLVPGMILSVGAERVTVFEEDPEKGEVRFEAALDRAATKLKAVLHAKSYFGSTMEDVQVPESGPVSLEFALRSGGVLLLEVRLPKAGQHSLSLQKWDALQSVWSEAIMTHLALGPDGRARIEPLADGRYRVLEPGCGLGSDAVEVRVGGNPARLSFDLSRLGIAKGRVVLPDSARLDDVRILVTGPGLDPQLPDEKSFIDVLPRPRFDGSFSVQIPGDRAVTIVPWHPILEPAAEGGTAELTEPREDLVLTMVEGARTTLRFDPAPKIEKSSLRGPRVLLYPGDPVGPPEFEHPLVQDASSFAFGRFRPGTWTLWIDPASGYAPVVVRQATLEKSGTDLGTLALAEGSRIRVKVLVKEGTAVPRISMWVHHEQPPTYYRGTNSRGEETVVVGGLGAGRFRVVAQPVMGGPGGAGLNETHELDGVNDLELTLDLR